MNLRDLDIDYDRDLVKSVRFKKGQNERPLWTVVESLPPDQMIMWVDRLDSLCPIASEWALAQALEKSAGLVLPKRAQFVRSIFAEINRLVYLTNYLGEIVLAAGITMAYQKMMILREFVLQKQEELMGARILPQVFKVGGVRRDLAVGDLQKVSQFILLWRAGWKEWLSLVATDEILMSRLDGLLALPRSEILKKGLWGIVGKAAQNIYDARLHQPHGAYAFVNLTFKYDSPLKGDALSRYNVVMSEVDMSLKIMENLLQNIPEEEKIKGETFTLQAGLYSGSAESAKGPITAVIEVDGSQKARTVRIFNVGQRIWPEIENYCVGIKAEDFNLAWASLGFSGEEAEI